MALFQACRQCWRVPAPAAGTGLARRLVSASTDKDRFIFSHRLPSSNADQANLTHCISTRQTSAAWDLYLNLKGEGMVSPDIYAHICEIIGSGEYCEEAISLYHDMVENHHPFEAHEFESLLSATSSDFRTYVKILEHMLHEGYFPSSSTLPEAIKAANEAHSVELALRLFEGAVQNEVDLDPVAYNHLLSLLISTENYRAFEGVLSIMEEREVERVLATHRAILGGLGRSGKLEGKGGMFEYLRQLLEDNVFLDNLSYRDVVNHTLFSGTTHRALLLQQRMNHSHYRLDTLTLARLLDACAREGLVSNDLERSHGVALDLPEIVQTSIPHGVSPAGDGENKYSSSSSSDSESDSTSSSDSDSDSGSESENENEGDHDGERQELSGSREGDEVRLNLGAEGEGGNAQLPTESDSSVGVTRRVSALEGPNFDASPSSEAQETVEFVRRLQRAGIHLHLLIYNQLLRYTSWAGMMETAAALFDEMKASGVEPDAASYARLMHHYSLEGLVNHAQEVVMEMERQGLRQRFAVDVEMSNAYARAMLVDECFDTVQESFHGLLDRVRQLGGGHIESLTLGDPLWGRAIYACAAAGLPDRAADTLSEMSRLGFKPTVWTYNSMLLAAAKAKDLRRALQLYQEMGVAGIEPNQFTYGNLLVACQSEGDFTLAKKIYHEMRAAGNGRSGFVYSVLVDTACESGRAIDALEWYRESTRLGFDVGETTLSRLVQALAAAQLRSLANEVLNEAQHIHGVRLSDITVSTLREHGFMS